MTIRFILGRAGSGKTTACLQTIADISKKEPLGPPLIFLVPEQATFQMERELAHLCGGGTFRAQVLSFGRLAVRLLQAAGGYPPFLSELGRQMVLRKLLQEQAGTMAMFGRAARQPRFCLQLSAQIRELNNYEVAPETLVGMARATDCPDGLRGKLQDLAELFGAYRAYTQGRFTDPEQTLELLAAVLRNRALPEGTRVWIDGFAGFTKQEFTVLSALLTAAAQVDIALCLDPSQSEYEPAEDDLFHPTQDTYLRLRRLAGEAGITALPPLNLPLGNQKTRYHACPPLEHLEAQFGRVPAEPYTEKAPALTFVTAAGSRAEVEAVARDILRLVREHGWRYREFGIILRDFSRYHDLLSAVFQEYGIPCFMDERRSASHHPLVEFIRSALEAALTNLSAEPVFQLLKTDLIPISRTNADRLENYVRAHGIRGPRWLDGKPWTYRLCLALDNEEQDERRALDAETIAVNQAKEIFSEIFRPFFQAVAGGNREASVYCRAIWALMESVNASVVLQNWAQERTAGGQQERASEHRQVWQGVVELLDQTAEILADQTLNLQEFSQILFTGLESLTLGLVPAEPDQVLVGSVERSRQPKLRAAYILGLSEGDFPARLREEGLFGDEERDSLAEAGIELAVTCRQRLFHEQYLSYIALTRSCDYLWASCPLADEEGKAKRPSALFNRLREIFPHNETVFVANTPQNEDILQLSGNPQNIAAALLLQAGKVLRGGGMTPFWSAVYNEALQQREIAELMPSLWRALSETNVISALSQPTVETLFGTPLRSSVSRLELYARCPFAHFVRYGLRLEERAEYRLDAPDMGTFYHAALREFVERLQKEGISWRDLGIQDAQERMNTVVDDLVPRLRGEILLSNARMRYLAQQLKETLARVATDLTLHAQNSRFLPAAVELSFGRGSYPAWHVAAGEQELYLHGQIDRVDVAEISGKAYLRVIDYKSNPMDLSLGDVWHGLSLQLLSYLAVVLIHAKHLTELPVEPAGVFYYGIQQPFERVGNPPADTVRKTPKLDGLLLADATVLEMLGGPDLVRRASLKKDGSFTKNSRVADQQQFQWLLDWMGEKIAELATEILDGKVEAYPYRKVSGQRACAYCAFMPLCRFDVTITGNRYRYLQKQSHENVLTAVAEKQEGGAHSG
jgi:ATP-dependent helicase/nuclease subunit B